MSVLTILICVGLQPAAPPKPVNPLFEKRAKTFGASCPPLLPRLMILQLFTGSDGMHGKRGDLFALVPGS
jgi:hypothetical protein